MKEKRQPDPRQYLDDLLAMEPVRLGVARSNRTIPTEPGVYLISEPAGAPLYIGETKGLRKGIGYHWAVRETTKDKFRAGKRKGAACNLAANMACEELELRSPVWDSPEFGEAVVRAMELVENMDGQWVEVRDDRCRTVVKEFAIATMRPRYREIPAGRAEMRATHTSAARSRWSTY